MKEVMQPNNSPSLQRIMLPILAELIARGDGTFVLKPRVPDSDLDTWISVKEAVRVIGSIERRTGYRLLDGYLVYRRVSKRKIVVSLRSAMAYKHATQDPEFWDDSGLQQQLKDRVKTAMMQLSKGLAY
jgi:hypothetical protein